MMTNAEAIRVLCLECDDWETSHCTPMERKEAFNMAIKALEAQELNCDGCVYQDRSVRKPFVDPCIWCKRNCIDHWKGKK